MTYDDAMLHYNNSLQSLIRRDYYDADNEIEDALKDFPDDNIFINHRQLLEEIIESYESVDYKKQNKVLRKFVNTNQNPYYLFCYADSFELLGDRENYEKYLKRACEKKNDDPYFWSTYGDACELNDKIQQAISSFKKALKLDSNNVDYLYKLIVLHSNGHEFQSALKYLNMIRKIQPNEIVYLDLAIIYCCLGNVEKAIKSFKYVYNYTTVSLENIYQYIFHNALLEPDMKIMILEQLQFADIENLYSDLNEYYLIAEIINIGTKYSNQGKVIFDLLTLYDHILDLKESLRVETNTLDYVVHYSNIDAMKEILLTEDSVKFRLYNVSYMNDPLEGDIILQIFDQLSINLRNDPNDINQGKPSRYAFSKSNTFIGSFSMAIDSLPLWTQYAKNGTGCCLVFDNRFFDNCDEDINETAYYWLNSDNNAKKDTKSETYCLYKVKYVDTNDLANEIDDKLSNVIYALQCVLEDTNGLDSVVFPIIINLIDQIKYLYKSKDYEHEKELRIVKYSVKEIYLSNYNQLFDHLYIEVNKPLFVEEVILGPKVERINEMAPIMYFYKNVNKVSKSGIKYQ